MRYVLLLAGSHHLIKMKRSMLLLHIILLYFMHKKHEWEWGRRNICYNTPHMFYTAQLFCCVRGVYYGV